MKNIIFDKGFDKSKIEFYGSKYTIGNGYFGFRGVMEEYGKNELTALTLSEIYDNANGWREIVNFFNPLYTVVYVNDVEVSLRNATPKSHLQELNIDAGIHKRVSEFSTSDGIIITLIVERFASIDNIHTFAMKYTIKANKKCNIKIKTGIDTDLWEINGPHFKKCKITNENDFIIVDATTNEMNYNVVEKVQIIPSDILQIKCENNIKTLFADLKGQDVIFFDSIVTIGKSTTFKNVLDEVNKISKIQREKGYEKIKEEHIQAWKNRWENMDVEINGDDNANIALKHSMFLLSISAPYHKGGIAIPARGLSGQVYKGAMFWDTEMYFLPMFLFTEPKVAKHLVEYRTLNLSGALKKAKEEGYEGAFFPWESQETGQEGCTYYNLTDIFTNRPVRTYFRDRQIHINSAVAYGIIQYYQVTNDMPFLLNGGLKTIIECCEFFYSFAYYKMSKDRLEFLDVTGPDEYHERVNNNAYTNIMAYETALGAKQLLNVLKEKDIKSYLKLKNSINDFEEKIIHIDLLIDKIYQPQPNEKGVIPQYDNYFKMEDISLEELKSKIINPNEYLGSPTGLAVNTQIAKQADTILLLSLLPNKYSKDIKEANFYYYEPRCEHGSSLSTCVYALLAAQIGNTEFAYKYFMKAAELDLQGNYKLFLGPLYIGGTHPAANGGSYIVAVQGFGGLSIKNNCVVLNPKLPKKWTKLSYSIEVQNQKIKVIIEPKIITISPRNKMDKPIVFEVNNVKKELWNKEISFEGTFK